MPDSLIIGFVCLTALVLSFAGGACYWARRQGLLGFSNNTYYQSLRYILNEQTDASLDAFVDSLPVTGDTLEIHLALGSLMRRRGEVSRAIRIHEHLLHATQLAPLQRQQAQLELALDFVGAGLLDRAENLFAELARVESSLTPDALQQLVLIYQSERDWSKAIAVADRLGAFPKQLGDNELALMKSHYCCELAQQAMDANQPDKARDYLNDAFRYSRQSVRASLLLARLAMASGNHAEALESLKKIPRQDADLISQSLVQVRSCYEAMGDRGGLRNYFFELLTRHPGSSLILSLAEVLRDTEGEDAAMEFMAAQLRLRPSVRVLGRLIELYQERIDDTMKENLLLLKQVLDKVVAEKPAYVCHRCGFGGQSLHWLCPSCKSWSSIKPVRGVAGE